MRGDSPGGNDADTPWPQDRRSRDLPLWHPRRLRGRRRENRHAEERGESYFVDRVSGRAFAMAALVLLLTIADGLFTVLLLERGCEEANPVMKILLDRSVELFFLGKYVLTAAFLPFALVMDRYRLFGTRFRVGQLLPVIAGLYLLLLCYQVGLWHSTRLHAWESARRPQSTRTGRVETRDLLNRTGLAKRG